MATIYLFRHGQASFGADDYDKLSPLGERQAAVLGQYLREHGITLDAAYSGDLLRQRETTQLALASQPGAVEHRIDPRFNEIDNDEQVKCLLPELVKTSPQLRELVDRGLSSSKDYQKVIDAVFNQSLGAVGCTPVAGGPLRRVEDDRYRELSLCDLAAPAAY